MGKGPMGEQIVDVLEVLDDHNLKYEVGPVATTIQGDLHEVCHWLKNDFRTREYIASQAAKSRMRIALPPN